MRLYEKVRENRPGYNRPALKPKLTSADEVYKEPFIGQLFLNQTYILVGSIISSLIRNFKLNFLIKYRKMQ